MSWKDCVNKPCHEVSYRFKSADMNNLQYVYRDQQGREYQGILSPRNQRYRLMWLYSLKWRLWLPPFSGSANKCEDGCSCVGPSTTEEQQYTHTVTFNFSANRRITITGSFTVNVTVKTGVCVPSPGTTFSLSDKDMGDAQEVLLGFVGEGELPDGAEEVNGGKQKKY